MLKKYLRPVIFVIFILMAFSVPASGATENSWNLILSVSAVTGDIPHAQEALKNGADVNAKDEKGMTPLMIAAGEGDMNMITFLLKNGADPAIKDSEGLTAKDHAARVGELGTAIALDRLLHAKKDTERANRGDRLKISNRKGLFYDKEIKPSFMPCWDSLDLTVKVGEQLYLDIDAPGETEGEIKEYESDGIIGVGSKDGIISYSLNSSMEGKHIFHIWVNYKDGTRKCVFFSIMVLK